MKERFPKSYTILLAGPPGVGKFEYCLDMIGYYLEKGEKIIYITTEQSPNDIKARAKKIGLNLEEYEDKKLIFIDCFSWSVGEKYGGFFVENPANLNEISINLDRAVKKLGKPVRIFFYSVSPLFLHNPQTAMTKFFQVLSSRVKSDYGFVLYVLQDGVHDPQLVNTLVYLVDGFIQMEFKEDEKLERKLRIHHLKGIPSDPNWVPFEVKNGFKLLN
ncbi:MAG: RAD55 family ATPase [Methanobacteriota archaeon]